MELGLNSVKNTGRKTWSHVSPPPSQRRAQQIRASAQASCFICQPVAGFSEPLPFKVPRRPWNVADGGSRGSFAPGIKPDLAILTICFLGTHMAFLSP
jgi:hypothetical protein